MSRDALHMRLCWGTVPSSRGVAPKGFGFRSLQPDDCDDLAALMWNAYRGTIDDEYAAMSDAVTDAHATLAGKWGPIIREASLAAVLGERLVGAVIVVRDVAHDMLPLLAFALTEPAWQGRGIGGWLIQESIASLSSIGVSELHLAVTHGNPAQRLYERIGFDIVT